ncbi:MAG: DUF655 domain-containing protein [Candidatus Aenigmatarchaeota archaeon]
MKDEHIIVLDYFPTGKPGSALKIPIVHGIGDKYFNLLEVSLKPNVKVEVNEKIYIGSGLRDKAQRIIRKIKLSELSPIAQSVLDEVLDNLIKQNEKRLIKIFNIAGPLTPKMHALELFRGIGKKHLEDILRERKIKPFESFEDLKNRIKFLMSPEKMIKERIKEELDDKDEYKLIVGNVLL